MKKDLLELKAEINEAKTKVAELTGKQTYLLEQLKTEFGCKTVEEAETKLVQMGTKITTLTEKLGKAIEKLKESYDFDL